MFGLQASQIRGAKSIDELAQVLAGCGPLSRNVLEDNFHLFSNAKPDGAGFDDGVLVLDQYNPNSPSHALWVRNGSARFDGDVYIQNLKAARLATATANWSNAAIPFVDAKDDTTGNAVRIYLPRTAGRDPNVRSGDKVAYMWGWDGNAYAISDYLDDKIGTIKIWSGNVANIPPGWALCNGVDNAAGSGYDLSGLFIKGGNTPGVTGGSSSHTHAAHSSANTGSSTTGISIGSAVTGISIASSTTGVSVVSSTTGITVDSNSTGVSVKSANTGINIADHVFTHNHSISGPIMITQGFEFPADVTPGPHSTDDQQIALTHSITDNGHSHGVSDPGHSHTITDTGHTHNVNDLGHSHGVSDPGHSHTITDTGHTHTIPQMPHDTVNHEPPFMILAYIERIS